MDTLPPGWPGTVSDVGDLVELLTVNALPDAPARISAVGPFVVEGADPFPVDAVAREGEVYSSALVAYVEEAETLRAASAAYRTALEQIAVLTDPDRDDDVALRGEVYGLAAAVLHAVAIP